jgi:hypothetical protein
MRRYAARRYRYLAKFDARFVARWRGRGPHEGASVFNEGAPYGSTSNIFKKIN